MPDISPRHLAFEKKKNSIQDSLSCPTHLWEKKNSVQDVLIMSYPLPKMVVSIQESPRHLPKISRTFQDISFQVTYREQKFPGHLYFSKISVQDALIMSYPYIGHWGVCTNFYGNLYRYIYYRDAKINIYLMKY